MNNPFYLTISVQGKKIKVEEGQWYKIEFKPWHGFNDRPVNKCKIIEFIEDGDGETGFIVLDEYDEDWLVMETHILNIEKLSS